MSTIIGSQGFSGTADEMALDIPAVTTQSIQPRGIPVFYNLDSGEPQPFDPWGLRQAGRVGSPAAAVVGDRGHGKTSLIMHIAMCFAARKGRGGAKFRINGDDHRRDNGVPEYQALAEDLGVEEVPLASYRLNCLDMSMGMTDAQQQGMIKELLKHVFGGKMKPLHSECLRYAIKIVRRDYPSSAELELLPEILRTITKTDIRGLLLDARSELPERHAGNQKFQDMQSRTVRLHGNILEAAVELASMIEELLDGEYAGIFGGRETLSQVLQNRFVMFDYSGLSDEAVMLVQSMMWYWRAAAIANQDFRFRFDMEFHDENYKLWAYPVYARAMHQYLKQLRAHSTFVVLSTQRLEDYETVGAKSSQIYRLATNAVKEVDIFLIGRQTPVSAEATGRRLRLTSEEVARIPTLKVGQWGLKIASEPIVWVGVKLTERLKVVSFSDDANNMMVV